jgi:hypothetical protein
MTQKSVVRLVKRSDASHASSTGRSGEHAINVPRPLPRPATMVELDESLKRLQRVITGSDDTGQWATVADANASVGR